jgi:hypothetical protein
LGGSGAKTANAIGLLPNDNEPLRKPEAGGNLHICATCDRILNRRTARSTVNLFRFVKGGDSWGHFIPFHKQDPRDKEFASVFHKGGKNEQEAQLVNL